MSAPRRKRARPTVKHDLHRGQVHVHSNDTVTRVRLGVGLGAWVEVSVAPRPSKGHGHDVVQLQLSLYNAQGDALGHSQVAGHRMPQLAWFFLDTRTGEAWQDNDYRDRDAEREDPPNGGREPERSPGILGA